MDLNELKKRTDKEDTILEIESFQIKGKTNYNFTERWKRKKENLFNAKKNYLVYEETQAIQRTNYISRKFKRRRA